ncbi:uncharacterized protein LOC104888671 [Beta vulgaris subsp. vulgaris]|uniref:uncharacterized protein LOC104888671 n=1 Tax=Beta vulgaris subsp. vulgaris TaxID=3555 RepID=UPI0020368C8A|nr:uncharacterized protein LOC104888671 [Beta vulgaris subsp. vulgaris]
MALVTPLRLHFLPTTPLLPPLHRCFSFSLKTKINAQLTHQSINNGGAAVVWFKHDLRIEDHPGIVAASKHTNVVPLYVFDHRILSRFPSEMIELVLLAVEDLRRSLREHGSNLMIRFGNVETVLQELVKEIKATVIYAEEEVEYDVRLLIATLEDLLAADPVLDWKPKIVLWRTSLYDVKNLDDLPALFEDMKKPQHDDVLLLGSPRLPSCQKELDWGHLPSMNDVSKFMDSRANREKEQWYSIKHTSAEAAFRMDHMKLFKSQSPVLGKSGISKLGTSSENSYETRRKRLKNSVFGTSKGNIVAGGTEVLLNAIAGYLRYLEGTPRDDWQEIHQRLRETEIRAGASFGALFQSALQLGIISSRRVYYEAIRYEKERNAGFLSPFGYSTATVSAAISAVCSIEWYWLLSLKSLSEEEELNSTRFWRWNGHLIQYTVSGCEGPAILLVHGFGAFFEHYRDNLSDIADAGNRVWALTLLGFGQSEKPNIVYSELMWAELLRDFIVEVVGEQAHLVGNSIGGYFISIVGGLWPSLVKSIVLMNTAGDVIPGYSSLLFFKERQISGAAWLGSRALLQYLRFSTRSLVKNCYPTRPGRADDWLIKKMLRASYDPGSIEVLESVFSFNLSIPLNHLLSRFKGKVLIIQGMKDPIADSGSKLAMFREHCEGIVIKELDAGHCPHDECPEEVNAMIREWISTIESRIHTESFDSSISLPCM